MRAGDPTLHPTAAYRLASPVVALAATVAAACGWPVSPPGFAHDASLPRPDDPVPDGAIDAPPRPDDGVDFDAPRDVAPDQSPDGGDATLDTALDAAPDAADAPDATDVPTDCTRACVGRRCGPSGCGDTCGMCAPTFICTMAGVCDCVSPNVVCNTECANLMTSTGHCGGCNQPCALGGACAMGLCSRPSNDACTTATTVVIPGMGLTATLVGSTCGADDSGTFCPGTGASGDVFYRFTAPRTGGYTLAISRGFLIGTSLDTAGCAVAGSCASGSLSTTFVAGANVAVVVENDTGSRCGGFTLMITGP